MKTLLVSSILLLSCSTFKSQTASDIFKSNDVKISWLGIDFSHVKLIGSFAQFFKAGENSTVQVRDKYFPDWNNIVIKEPERYDVKGMLRKGEIQYDIDDISRINEKTHLEDIEAANTPNYSQEDLKNFINQYDIKDKDGIGILFIAESLDKNSKMAYFDFVAINMKDKSLLINKRLRGDASGFGLRNFWAGAIHEVFEDIKDKEYKAWKHEYK